MVSKENNVVGGFSLMWGIVRLIVVSQKGDTLTQQERISKGKLIRHTQ